MNRNYPVLRIRQIGTKFEFELTDPLSMQIIGIDRKKAKFTAASRNILASYSSLVGLAGSGNEKNRKLFHDDLNFLAVQAGEILSSVLKDLGFDARKNSNLALALDDQTVKIPWELAFLRKDPKTGNREMLCEKLGVGRLRVVKAPEWFNPPDKRRKNKALVVGNDYKNTKRKLKTLEHAEEEADIVANIIRKHGFRDPIVLKGPNATKGAILKELREGVDLFHFSGHGEMSRNSSKLNLNDFDLSAIEFENERCSAPRLTFFNACESSIDTPKKEKPASVPHSWAYAMAGQGGRVFIGTLWTVCEPCAGRFAEEFYTEFFVGGKTLAEAMKVARTTTYLEENCKKYTDEPSDYTWPAYMLYGIPTMIKHDIMR